MTKKEEVIEWIIIIVILWAIISIASLCFAKDEQSVDSMAEYYASNYYKCTANEKALMLADNMRRTTSFPFEVVEQSTETKRILITRNGRVIWPVNYKDDNTKVLSENIIQYNHE